jgi:hypothetical protein
MLFLSGVVRMLYYGSKTLWTHFIAYGVWVLSDFSLLFLVTRYFVDVKFIIYFSTLLLTGLFVLLTFVLFELNINLLSVGALNAYFYFQSFTCKVTFIFLIMFVIIAGIYAGYVYSRGKWTIKQILFTFSLGALWFLVSYAIVNGVTQIFF